MHDRDHTRLRDEQLFGIKLCQDDRQDCQATPPDSFTSPDGPVSRGSSAGQPTPTYKQSNSGHHGISTPPYTAGRERRAQLVLSDLGDGRAEVMFSPTPLKPSSPPRIPNMITPIRTPLSRKIAARSASSPALLTLGAKFVLGSALKENVHRTNSNSNRTPGSMPSPHDLSALKSLKRPHALMSSNNKSQATDRHHNKRHNATLSKSFSDLGRGKENVPPMSMFGSTPITATPVNTTSNERSKSRDDETYGRNVRRVQSESFTNIWPSPPKSTTRARPLADRTDQNTKTIGAGIAKTMQSVKKLSAEECALSLVSLAHGM